MDYDAKWVDSLPNVEYDIKDDYSHNNLIHLFMSE